MKRIHILTTIPVTVCCPRCIRCSLSAVAQTCFWMTNTSIGLFISVTPTEVYLRAAVLSYPPPSQFSSQETGDEFINHYRYISEDESQSEALIFCMSFNLQHPDYSGCSPQKINVYWKANPDCKRFMVTVVCPLWLIKVKQQSCISHWSYGWKKQTVLILYLQPTACII